MSCLCILEINPSSVTSFANIFSHSVGWLFILFIVSLHGFAVQKLLILIRSHLFVFVFFFNFHYFKRWIKKILLQFPSNNVLPMFSSQRSIVFHLAFRSLIHFDFIFVYGVRECSNFILLHFILFILLPVQFPKHHLLKIN